MFSLHFLLVVVQFSYICDLSLYDVYFGESVWITKLHVAHSTTNVFPWKIILKMCYL